MVRAEAVRCISGVAVWGTEAMTAGIGAMMREADRTGVCVSGAGSGGAMAQPHAGTATGEAGNDAPDCSW